MFGNETLFLQRFLSCADCYHGKIDGLFGPATDQALLDFEGKVDAIATELGRFESRSEACIATLLQTTQRKARQFLSAAKTVDLAGATIKIISGTRTYVEQSVIYAQGRTKPGRIVTKAGPGQSNHNFGIAFDIGLFQGAEYLDESPLYRTLGPVGKNLGLDWGGDWSSIVDVPHYELHTGLKLEQVRQAFESGSLKV